MAKSQVLSSPLTISLGWVEVDVFRESPCDTKRVNGHENNASLGVFLPLSNSSPIWLLDANATLHVQSEKAGKLSNGSTHQATVNVCLPHFYVSSVCCVFSLLFTSTLRLTVSTQIPKQPQMHAHFMLKPKRQLLLSMVNQMSLNMMWI